MTTEHWVTMVLYPILADVVRSGINQPKPTPETELPKGANINDLSSRVQRKLTQYRMPLHKAPATLLLLILTAAALAQPPNKSPRPWMNTSLSPDERASMVIKQM